MASADGERKYDLIVFGASGFTGQFVVEELARIEEEESEMRWAIAGRSQDKLDAVLQEVAYTTGKKLKNVEVVIANVNDNQSMDAMCQQAKVLLNCVGPYRFYGEQVVRACVENGCHHLDISGEPQFLEGIQLNYNQKAKEAKVYVVGACGFDSIPADMGVCYTKKEFPGVLNTIEGYLSGDSGPEGSAGHFATWQSAIHGFANAGELIKLRKQFKHQPMPKFEPRLQKRGAVFFSNERQRWSMVFPGADSSVVRRSQRYIYENQEERPAQFGAYVTTSSFFSLVQLIFLGFIFSTLAKFGFGRSLLEKFPRFFSCGFFSHEGPTRKQMEGTTFTWNFYSEGFSDKDKTKPDVRMATQVTGPEPGYIATPIAIVQAALVVLNEPDKLPQGGGVFSPGAIFNKTSLVDRLNQHGIKFTITSAAQPITA
ncbi:saccharopine dehydrogenase-like oxidoreductase [Amphiura filiformis]|uniref:saccharopine dehydrogenase-like oxidoreductase n=1 Tax=Amphiura filiformis TaxID=82378 RepID=UPI003B21EA0E